MACRTQLTLTAEDVTEIRALAGEAKSSGVRDVLQNLAKEHERRILSQPQAIAQQSGSTPSSSSQPAAAAAAAANPAGRAGNSVGSTPADGVSSWTAVSSYAFEPHGFNSPTVSVDLRIKGVKDLPLENVVVDFANSSLDVKVVGWANPEKGGKAENLRFFKNNLEHDVDPVACSFCVKKNHVVVTLHKVKGEHGYEHWTDLTSRKGGPTKKTNRHADKAGMDGSNALMELMKNMYDEGDDEIKRAIGESMAKAQTGQLPEQQ